jgi:hypothetical protein
MRREIIAGLDWFVDRKLRIARQTRRATVRDGRGTPRCKNQGRCGSAEPSAGAGVTEGFLEGLVR